MVELCRNAQFTQAQNELYAEDAVSVEPCAMPPAFDIETRGLKGIFEKNDLWEKIVGEGHRIEISDPLVAERSFAVKMVMDLTLKEQGRMVFNELCVYQVKDVKIVSGQFHY